MILHTLKQSIYSFLTKIIAALVRSQRICFINKKYTSKRLFYNFLHFQCCLSHIAAYKS